MQKFKEHYITGIKTPILLPDGFKAKDIKDGKVGYLDEKGKKHYDEPLFVHGKERIILNQFRDFFK